MRFIITKKNVVKCNQGPVYQNEGPVYQNEGPVNSNNTTINSGSEYDAKLRRYEALLAKKRYAWMMWSYDKDQPELKALDKWLSEHANG